MSKSSQDPTTSYRQNLDVAWRRIRGKDSAILVLPMTCEVVGLNEVAVRVWELIEDWQSVPRIVEVIESEFDAPRDRILEDVGLFLEDLLVRELAERRA